MKKIVVATAVVSATLFAGGLFAADGKTLFSQKGCTACHDLNQDRAAMGLGPAIKQISAKYKGDSNAVVTFLKGQGKPRVYPDKYPTMQGQIAITKTLPQAELEAIAKYLVSQ